MSFSCIVFLLIHCLVPIGALLTAQKVSSRCDVLMSTLNAVRIRSGEECHERISWLETSLMRLNYNQGLGFVVAGECL